MDCREIKHRMSEYIDGKLPEETAAHVSKHLETCAHCNAAYESMKRIVSYMNDMEIVDEPQGFLSDVKTRLEKQSSWGERIRRWFSPPVVKIPLEVAAAALVVVVVIHMSGVGGGPALYEITFSPDPPKSEEVLLDQPAEEPAAERQAVEADKLGAVEGVVPTITFDSAEKTEPVKGKDLESPTPKRAAEEIQPTVPAGREKTPDEVKPDPGSLKKGDRKQRIAQPEVVAETQEIKTVPPTPTGKTGETEAQATAREKGLEAKDEKAAISTRHISVKTPLLQERASTFRALSTTNEIPQEAPLLVIIKSIGGRLIAFEYGDARNSGRVTAMRVEVPADSVEALVKKLEDVGEVGKDIAAPDRAQSRSGKVVVRIHLR